MVSMVGSVFYFFTIIKELSLSVIDSDSTATNFSSNPTYLTLISTKFFIQSALTLQITTAFESAQTLLDYNIICAEAK